MVFLAVGITRIRDAARHRTTCGLGPLRIAHPSGIILVDAEAETRPGGVHIRHATVYRTARRLFTGEVFSRLSGAAHARPPNRSDQAGLCGLRPAR